MRHPRRAFITLLRQFSDPPTNCRPGGFPLLQVRFANRDKTGPRHCWEKMLTSESLLCLNPKAMVVLENMDLTERNKEHVGHPPCAHEKLPGADG
jgi:hypothetical protein